MISFGPQGLSLLRAARLMEAGNFNAAADCLQAIEPKRERVWKSLMRCYCAAHRFEEAIGTYETMPDDVRTDPECRQLYMTAAANLKQSDTIRNTIEDLLQTSRQAAADRLLCRLYPFARRLEPEIHEAVAARVVSSRSELVLDDFDSVLKCAHDLLNQGAAPQATALQEALRSRAGDPASRIKLTMLDAQAHFLSGRYDLQLAAVNGILAEQGIAPVALIDPAAPFVCDNLKALPVERAGAEGPLVSIVMPAFNSAATIGYALESLRAQSYRNIEVIVVDDASRDDTRRIVSELAAADPRLRLIGLDSNVGTYVARNLALAAAGGEYVTTQDADDWAHPQKIATAVAALQKDDSIVATWVKHIRCSSRQGFRALSGYIRPDASSLMFRRKPVTERVGWYDSVRAAGDGEFHLRIERSFGRRSIRQLDKLLSFVSWSDGSLSGSGEFEIDSDLGVFSPSRNAYRRSFGLWHETSNGLFMPFPLERRPFAAPDALLPARGEATGSGPAASPAGETPAPVHPLSRKIK